MANFSKASVAKLVTCHNDLRIVMNVVVVHFDCTILFGRRVPSKQFSLFKKGRELRKGRWVVVDRSKVVTYCDGYKKIGQHNTSPLSDAVDATPYPVDWKNRERAIAFGGYVLGTARRLYACERITHMIGWGADWDSDTFGKDHTFIDLPHFFVVRRRGEIVS